MRYLLLPVLLLSLIFSADASTTLRVQNPQKTWQFYTGNIDTAVLSIKPKGAYFECGLHLTFSSAPYNTPPFAGDTFEVQMPFELPEGSFINDSWLWVGNQIVQAKLAERNRATVIYENIVQRRQDPSILFKNSPTQYELRVYPMPAMQQRKVKISYMVPARWGVSKVSCPIPMNIIKASAAAPYFKILSYTDADWAGPAVTELPGVGFQTLGADPFATGIIPAADISNVSDLNYSLQSPMQNGVFSAVYPTGANEGYYQFVMMPNQAMGVSSNKKTAFLFDYEGGNSSTSPNELLNKTRQLLLDNYQPTDSFNLFFSQLNIYRYSPTWLPCDSATITTVFNQLLQNNPVSNYSNLPSLLAQGIQFIQDTHSQSDIVLLTNSDNFNTVVTANQLISDLQQAMGPTVIPIHIADFQDYNIGYYWVNNRYYYGAEYFYTNLSALTGGNFESVRMPGTYYYSYELRSFSATIDRLFEQLQGYISGFSSNTDAATGFCYSVYDNKNGGVVYLNKPYIQIGRYSGTLPLSVEVSGMVQGSAQSQTMALGNYFIADSLTHKMWMAHYLAELESGTAINNQTKSEIIDSSMAARVLSLYTAFLALEPSDTVSTCATCNDETNQGGGSVGVEGLSETADISIKAFPNPFSSQITLQVQVPDAGGSLKIYNTLGQLVKVFDLDGSSGNAITLTWDGTDTQGNELSSGVFIVVLQTKWGKKTMRIVKS